jgi:molybdenum cofactor cytidylyltransferase
MFTPADYPSIASETVARLAALFRQSKPLLVVPRHNGRRGHPVCCARELIPEFLSLPAASQAREVIHRHARETLYVDVDDPGILRDIDDPAAYAELSRGSVRP